MSREFSETYNLVSERLWEKLEARRGELRTDCVDWKEPFPYDQFAEAHPEVKQWVKEVELEFNYELSESQCSWAVWMFIRGGPEAMGLYNTRHNLNLSAKR